MLDGTHLRAAGRFSGRTMRYSDSPYPRPYRTRIRAAFVPAPPQPLRQHRPTIPFSLAGHQRWARCSAGCSVRTPAKPRIGSSSTTTTCAASPSSRRFSREHGYRGYNVVSGSVIGMRFWDNHIELPLWQVVHTACRIHYSFSRIHLETRWSRYANCSCMRDPICL